MQYDINPHLETELQFLKWVYEFFRIEIALNRIFAKRSTISLLLYLYIDIKGLNMFKRFQKKGINKKSMVII